LVACADYGDAITFPAIFAADKPMLKHPDSVYAGPVLRIPPLCKHAMFGERR